MTVVESLIPPAQKAATKKSQGQLVVLVSCRYDSDDIKANIIGEERRKELGSMVILPSEHVTESRERTRLMSLKNCGERLTCIDLSIAYQQNQVFKGQKGKLY